MKRLLGAAILALALVIPSTARAGEYEVHACTASLGNGSWFGEPGPGGITYSACFGGEGIVTTHGTSNSVAPHGTGARHVFTAPPGTHIVRFRGHVKQNAISGWWAGISDYPGHAAWGGFNGTTWGRYAWIDVGVFTQQLAAQVRCEATTCPRPTHQGLLAIGDVVVTVRDDVRPNVSITGGLKSPSGWLRGDQDLTYETSDNTGMRAVRVLVDDAERGSRVESCDIVKPIPCPNLAGTLRIPDTGFPGDGKHRVVLRGFDSAGNLNEASREVWVDNTPPTAPLDVTLHGGAGWRATNAFSVSWVNPKQSASGISAARYRLCPAIVSAKPQSCAQGRVEGKDISSLRDLRVPGPGEWRLSLWLEDLAGNADPERSVSMRGLGLDEDAPELTFTAPQPSDPARLRVHGSDATTEIGEAWIEARRKGESAWRSLPTTLEASGFSALLDDEKLPRGRYDLRARARDLAGNERTIDQEPDGRPAARTLPIRLGTRLAVGQPRRVRARGSKGRYRTVLVMRPRTRFGRTIPIRGRLTMPGANPLAGADVEVWQRIRLPRAEWQRVGQVHTSVTGRFRFKALPGPSRLLRFRYPGTATIRARSSEIDLRVSAVTSMNVTRHNLVNGEEVRFYGRLKGRQRGATGKLIHVQVYTRGRWSTFATPRANRRTGLWRVPYRFTATRGRVTYRFRAVVPRESTFPYETGASKSIKISVAGL